MTYKPDGAVSKRYGEEEFFESRGFKRDHENMFSPLPPLC